MDVATSLDFSRVLARVIDIEESQLDQLVADTSLTPQQLINKEGYINGQEQHQIIANAINYARLPGLGVVFSANTPPTITLGMVAVAAMSCRRVSEALQILLRYQTIRAPFNHTQLRKDGNGLFIQLCNDLPDNKVGIFLRDAWIVTIANSLTLLLGRDILSVNLELGFSAPDYKALYHKYLQLPFHFEKTRTQFVLPVDFGDKIIPTHDEHTKRWAIELCEQQLKQIQNTHSFAERVRQTLRKLIDQQPHQEQVAKELFVSTRTFSRRLKEEGFTFKQLVDEEQKRLTLYYFENTDLTFENISSRLGYQDISSFRRAFKRWFNEPPSEFARKIKSPC